MNDKHKTNKTSLGSSFDEFLKEEGLLEESTQAAAKRVLGMQIARETDPVEGGRACTHNPDES